jgi:hypothetical protein
LGSVRFAPTYKKYASATRTFTRLAYGHFSFTGTEMDLSFQPTFCKDLRRNADVANKDSKPQMNDLEKVVAHGIHVEAAERSVKNR